MSVPARRGPWWYYTRTEEGKDYAHPLPAARPQPRRAPAGRRARGRGADPARRERAGRGLGVLRRRGAPRSATTTAGSPTATDRTGNEKYELRFRPLDAETAPATAAESVPETGYGLAWSAGADYVFYVRLDEAQRPYQLWRHRLGTDPAGDVLVFEEADRRFSLGTGSTRDAAFVLVGLHSTNTTEWLAIPSDDPLAEPRVGDPAPRGRRVRRRPPHAQAPAGPAGSSSSPTTALGTSVSSPPPTPRSGDCTAAWREVVAHRPGVRVEDVDAFAGALVLSERAEAADPGARPAAARTAATPSAGDLLASGWIVPSIDSPSSTWLGANPEPDAPVLRIGRTSMVTPSSVLQVALATREETLLKQEPVLGDFDPARYTTYREWAVAPDGTRVPISVVHRRDLDAPRPVRPLRLRRLRDLHRPVVLAPPALAPRPRRRLRHRARARRRRDGPRLVRGRADGAQGQHVLRLHRLRAPPGRARASPAPAPWPAGAASAGGLLIGAVANQAPELFRALVAQVPFVDCVTTMLDDELPLTVGEWEEWGNPLADESAYRRMLDLLALRQRHRRRTPTGRPAPTPTSSSPPASTTPGSRYWEPAKWVAKLRALSPTTRVLLRTELGAGPRRALGALRRLEGGGPGLRLPPRRRWACSRRQRGWRPRLGRRAGAWNLRVNGAW